MFRIGRRAASHSYPTRRRGEGGILQVGYDQPIETVSLAAAAPLPRDVALNPLQVQLTGVTPGNFLEIDCTASFENTDNVNPLQAVTAAAVTFAAVPPPFGAGWFQVVLSAATRLLGIDTEDSIDQIRNFACVEIPAGAVNATVQIFYAGDTSGAIDLAGIDDEGIVTTLKVSELGAGFVTQAPPTILVSVV